MFLNKTPPAWAKGLFIMVKDLWTVTHPDFISLNEFIKSQNFHPKENGKKKLLDTSLLLKKDNTIMPMKKIWRFSTAKAYAQTYSKAVGTTFP